MRGKKTTVMETCYEYFSCHQKNCLMRKEMASKKCWEVENTLCNHPSIQLIRDITSGPKKNACISLGCIYYKASHGLSMSGINI